MHPDLMSEEALMTAYCGGDERAFRRLVAVLGPKLHGFFMRTFRDAATADDLLQTTLLKLHRARGDWRRGEPLRPWLFTIAARVRLDELRRRKNQPDLVDEESLARREEAQSVAAAPAAGLASADAATAVRDALAQLPESQQVIVHLHRWEGMTFPEIATVLGTTEGAVKLRAFRAYERLRELLRPALDLGGRR